MLHIIDCVSRIPEFTTTFELPKVQVNSIELAEVEVPFSYKTIRSGNTGFCKLGTTEINVYGGYNKITLSSTNNTIVTQFDGKQFTINITPGDYSPSLFCSTLQAALAADPLNQSVIVTQDKQSQLISLTITRTANYNVGGIVQPLSPLANVIGFVQSPATEEQKINYQSYQILMDTNTNISPDNNVYSLTASKVMEFNSYDVSKEMTYYTNQIQSNYGQTITITVNAQNIITMSSVSNITINITDQSSPIHWMAYELGFRSNKSGLSVTADVPLILPFRYPVYSHNYLTFTYSDLGTLNIQIPDGNYTIYDLCTTLKNNIIASNPAITDASVVCSKTTFKMTITITTPTSVAVSATLAGYPEGTEYNNYPRSKYIGPQLGLIGSITSNLVAHVATFTFQNSIDLSGQEALYIRSQISRTHESTGFYKADNVIMRVPVKCGPNQLIVYRPENNPILYLYEDTTLLSITSSLTHEDGQLVDLCGRSWSYNIRFNY